MSDALKACIIVHLFFLDDSHPKAEIAESGSVSSSRLCPALCEMTKQKYQNCHKSRKVSTPIKAGVDDCRSCVYLVIQADRQFCNMLSCKGNPKQHSCVFVLYFLLCALLTVMDAAMYDFSLFDPKPHPHKSLPVFFFE